MLEGANTKAIVLKRQDIRENDSLVVFYTKEQGKVSLIGRGTKKPGSKLVGHLEPLNLIDLMVVPGKSYSYVGGVKAEKSFFNLREDLASLKWAFAGINSFLRLVSAEGEKDERLFFLLYNYLNILDGLAKEDLAKKEGEISYAVFIFRLLTIIGYRPQIEKCLKCSLDFSSELKYFDLQNGGLLCQDCFIKTEVNLRGSYFKISDSSIKILRFILDEEKFLGKKLKFNLKLGHELANLANNYLEFRL